MTLLIEMRTECLHPWRRLKRTIEDLGLKASVEILKLFYSCSFKNKVFLYICICTERITFIFSARSPKPIQNKKHFEMVSFIFHFSEQLKIMFHEDE